MKSARGSMSDRGSVSDFAAAARVAESGRGRSGPSWDSSAVARASGRGGDWGGRKGEEAKKIRGEVRL